MITCPTSSPDAADVRCYPVKPQDSLIGTPVPLTHQIDPYADFGTSLTWVTNESYWGCKDMVEKRVALATQSMYIA